MKKFLLSCFGLAVLLCTPVNSGAETPYQAPEPGSLREVPDTAPLQYLSARDHLELGDTRTAVKQLKRSLRRFPRHQPSVLTYLKLVEKLKGTSQTITEAKDLVSRVEDPLVLRDFFYSTTGDTDRYLPLLQWLYRREYFDPFLSRVYGEVLIEKGDFRAARSVLKDSFYRYRKPRLQLLYSLALAHRGYCRASLANLRNVTRNRPGWPRPHLIRARILWRYNRERAREALEDYLVLRESTRVPEKDQRLTFDCGKNDL